MYRTRKSIKTESRLVVVFHFGGNENILKWTAATVAQLYEYTKHKLYTSNV